MCVKLYEEQEPMQILQWAEARHGRHHSLSKVYKIKESRWIKVLDSEFNVK